MHENVVFWRFLMVSRSKSSWSPPTFQRFSPEFSQQSTKSRKFQFQIVPFRKNQAAVGSVRDLLKETPWKSLPFEFSAPTPREKRVHSPKRIFWDGVSTYMFLNHEKTRSNASAFPKFLFLQHFDLSKLPIDSYRASPCDSGFSTILLLHYGWIEVEGVWCVKIVWMIKKAYFRWRWWLVTTQTPRNMFHGWNL